MFTFHIYIFGMHVQHMAFYIMTSSEQFVTHRALHLFQVGSPMMGKWIPTIKPSSTDSTDDTVWTPCSSLQLWCQT
jgi:hypothetical protein